MELRKPILETLAFFATLNRPLSPRELEANIHLAKVEEPFLSSELNLLHKEGVVISDGIFYTLRNTPHVLGMRSMQDGCFNRKMKEVRRLGGVLGWVPFIDFALVAGSIALKNPREQSDIDVILGAKEGRIFTVRVFASWFLWLWGLRRHSGDNSFESRNKVCLNHFVTPQGYELRPPYDLYWNTLYKNIFPIYGEKNSILHFFEANSWSLKKSHYWDFFKTKKNNPLRNLLEMILGSSLGDLFEYVVGVIQHRRFKSSMENIKDESFPRVRFSEEELEFHPDTRRANEYIRKSNDLLEELTFS